MASKVCIISTWTVNAGANLIDEHNQENKIIELTPWDILELQIEYAQGGLVYPKPTSEQVGNVTKSSNTTSLIDHLRASLSRALDFFPPLCGRLGTTQEHDGTTSFFINCNNVGAQLIHAVADGVRVSDIVDSEYIPYVVRDLFPLNGVLNQEATSKPILAVQVTELVDGIFIGCSGNHVVLDGISFWHFCWSWAEISRGSNVISKTPFLRREFPFGTKNISNRISIPNEKLNGSTNPLVQLLEEKEFHFTKENVEKLKVKANHEMSTTKISSLQAVLAHVWRSVIRCRHLDHNQETTFEVSVNMREKLNPPLPQGFFGNAICPATITIKTGELLTHDLGWAALKINEMIAAHDHEKLKSIYENWTYDPEILKLSNLPSNYFMLHGSPRFGIHGYNFGWGKPIAYKSGMANMLEGKIAVSPGIEQGSMILEVCLSPKTIHALEEDKTFGEFVTKHVA